MTVGSLGSSRVRLVRLLIDHRLDVEVVGWPARRAQPVDTDGGYGRSPRGPQIHGAMALPARSVPIVDPDSGARVHRGAMVFSCAYRKSRSTVTHADRPAAKPSYPTHSRIRLR